MCDYTNREEAMVTIARDDQGIPTIWSDPCIAPIVKALNAGGLPTVASCCGHGNIPESSHSVTGDISSSSRPLHHRRVHGDTHTRCGHGFHRPPMPMTPPRMAKA